MTTGSESFESLDRRSPPGITRPAVATSPGASIARHGADFPNSGLAREIANRSFAPVQGIVRIYRPKWSSGGLTGIYRGIFGGREEKRSRGRYFLPRVAVLVTRPSTAVVASRTSRGCCSLGEQRGKRPGKSVLFPAIASRRCVAGSPVKRRTNAAWRATRNSRGPAPRIYRMQEVSLA